MTISNILVAFSGSDQSRTALEYAYQFARKNNAHVTGVLAHGLPNVLFSYGAHLPQGAMDNLEKADKAHRAKVKAAFFDVETGHPADHIHYMDVYGDADEKMMEVGRAFDITFMGHSDRDSNYPHMEVHPDVIARNSGRPVMVVPDDYVGSSGADALFLVAWDGRRAAAHALASALCIMGEKARVSLLYVGKKDDLEAKTAMIMVHLERHGIDAQVVHRERKGSVAATIQSAVQETGAGILVMGAYEHAKFAEDLFGGVTNRILNTAGIPVLMAH